MNERQPEGGSAETLDALLRGKIKLYQPRKGARVSMDALLVADFAAAGRAPGRGGRILDLGCGGGVIGIALAAGDAAAEVVGVELQGELVALARRNATLNAVAERCWIVEGDVTRAAELPIDPQSFDVVVSNPPYHDGERTPPEETRALARHQLAGTVADFVAAARRFVKPRGRVVMVFPAERIAELVAAFVEAGLAVRTLQSVHSVAGEPARRVLIEGVRDWKGGTTVAAPLVIHGEDRKTYTPAAARILGD